MIKNLLIIISFFLLSSCAVNNIIIGSKDKMPDIPTYVDNAAKVEFSKDYYTPRIFEITYEGNLYQYLIKEGTLTFHKCIRLRTNYIPAVIGGFISAILIGMLLKY